MYNSDPHHIGVPHSYLHKFSLCPSLTGLYHLSRYRTCSGKKSLRTPPPSLCTSYFIENFNSASKNNRPWLFTVTENPKKGIESGITYFSAKRLFNYFFGQWCTYPLPNENSGCAVQPNDCVEAYFCFLFLFFVFFCFFFSDQIYRARGIYPMLHITTTGIGRVKASL